MDIHKLWKEISRQASALMNLSWVILGDFNAIKRMNEKCDGLAKWENYQIELDVYCKYASLNDLQYIRSFYTWSNKSERDRRIVCKLDKILTNDKCLDTFIDSMGIFLPNSISDHCPRVILRGKVYEYRRSPFKFFNF